MRKMRIIVAGLAVVAFVGIPAYANCGSCETVKKAADKGLCSEKCFDALDLTDAQQEKIEKLFSDCSKIGCDMTSGKKLAAGLKSVLTEEQFTAVKEKCTKEGCWLKSSDKAPKCKDGDSASLRNADLQIACGGSCGDKDKDDGNSDA